MKKVCKICGKPVSAPHVKICRKCFLKQSKFEVRYCIDCGKKLNNEACYRNDLRCKHCARIHQYAIRPETNPFFGLKGKLSPKWKGGIEKRTIHCVDCGKELNHSAIYCENTRCKSCARKEQYKDPKNHPAWEGGVSFAPYSTEWTPQLREAIRIRDGHKCQNCGKTAEQELKELNRKLNIHYIDYNKNNCNEENLITLCTSCNVHANRNRDYWFAFLQKLLTVFI